MISKEQILTALKAIYDPEVPVNIVDLGMIYEVNIDEVTEKVNIKMTLTAPGCPLAGVIIKQVKIVLKSLKLKDFNVDMVFEPQWTPDMMSDDAKKTLGWEG